MNANDWLREKGIPNGEDPESFRRASQFLHCAHRGELLRREDCGCSARESTVEVYQCARHDECTLYSPGRTIAKSNKTGRVPMCLGCPEYTRMAPRKLILSCPLSPGDVLTLTAAIESLHATYPGQYLTDVRTSCPALWEHNPHITAITDDDPEAKRIAMHYPQIDRSNQTMVNFLTCYTEYLGEQLGKPLRCTVNRPCVYLSDDEKKWMSQVQEHFTNGRPLKFWLVNAGAKRDFTLKQWPVEHYQRVIDATCGKIQWVQVGEASHGHPALKGVIDLRGKTDLRQLVRLAYHAEGGLGPVTFLQHLMAAHEKPYICLVGGREPATWVSYPKQHTLHTIGQLPCCVKGACWKSRVLPLEDGDKKDESLCARPVLGLERAVGQCMAMISPGEVLQILERFQVCS